MGYKTEQEAFWSGEFGNDYIERNACTKKSLAAVLGLYSRIAASAPGLKSVLEFGANIGINLKAIKTLIPDIQTAAIEINHQAAARLKEDSFFEGKIEVFETSILEYEPVKKYDLAIGRIGHIFYCRSGILKSCFVFPNVHGAQAFINIKFRIPWLCCFIIGNHFPGLFPLLGDWHVAVSQRL